MADACPRCSSTEIVPAIAEVTKKRLVLSGEALFALGAALGIAWRSVPAAVVAVVAALATFAVSLRARQRVCAKCGWTMAVRRAPPA